MSMLRNGSTQAVQGAMLEQAKAWEHGAYTLVGLPRFYKGHTFSTLQVPSPQPIPEEHGTDVQILLSWNSAHGHSCVRFLRPCEKTLSN